MVAGMRRVQPVDESLASRVRSNGGARKRLVLDRAVPVARVPRRARQVRLHGEVNFRKDRTEGSGHSGERGTREHRIARF